MKTFLVLALIVALVWAVSVYFLRRSAMSKCHRCQKRHRIGERTCPHCNTSLG